MSYLWQSIKTKSYWHYALLRVDSFKTFFAVLGTFWMLIEILDFFKVIPKDCYPDYFLFPLLIVSFIIVVITRRPIFKIKYKLPGKDVTIETRIGNLFSIKGQKIISTNTTFDTDIANGIISSNSVQGQFTNTYYPQNVHSLDQIIANELNSTPSENYQKASGKNKKYPMGTTVRIDIGVETFYLLAMSDLNYNNTAQTTFENVLTSIDALWEYIATKGENDDIILPLIGTGKGRISTNRKRVIANIAQSFINASEQKIFSSKLIIVIHPKDAANFGINLFEVKDFLNSYLT